MIKNFHKLSTKHLIIALFTLFPILLHAQIDSIKTDSTKDNCSYGQFILPISLIIVGSSLSGSDFEKDFKTDLRNWVGNDFEFVIDDYIQYAPLAELYAANLLGVKAKNNWFDQTKNLAIANLSSSTIVLSLKKITDKNRPNGTPDSFPSGHSIFAFTNATVLYHEYKETNLFFAYSGYAFATTTGVFRMLNNRHWLSDVLTGAGLGILVGNLTCKFEPLKDWHPFGLGKENNVMILPQFNDDQYGVTMVIGF